MKSFVQADLPTSPGVYILHLKLLYQRLICIGKLGDAQFLPGDYLYVGSARGCGGLRSRVGRHLEGSEKRHWHIDWLRPVVVVKGYYYLETNKELECDWNQVILNLPGCSVPIQGFGASDCRGKKRSCAAHLIFFSEGLNVNQIRRILPGGNGTKVVYEKIKPVWVQKTSTSSKISPWIQHQKLHQTTCVIT